MQKKTHQSRMIKNRLPYVRKGGEKNACRNKPITPICSKTVYLTSDMLGIKLHAEKNPSLTIA
jgi:hypothetical protein